MMLWRRTRFYEMHAPQFRRENTPGKPHVAICGDARLCRRWGLVHLDPRGSAAEVNELEPLVALQDVDELPCDTYRERALLCQLLDGDGSAARSQKRLNAATRRIRQSASCPAEKKLTLPTVELRVAGHACCGGARESHTPQPGGCTSVATPRRPPL